MRALVMAVVLSTAAPVLADPSPMFIRAPSARHIEVARAAPPKPVRISLALRPHDAPEQQPVRDPAKRQSQPTLMEQLRDRIYEELPAVKTAVVAPLPISSANGTLAGVGLLGEF
jgi:hypothetical protein